MVYLCSRHRDEIAKVMTVAVERKFDPWTDNVVYYMNWKNKTDVCKIGTTSNLKMRLGALGKMTRRPILLAAEPGSYYLEKKRHRQFSHLRIDKEVFRLVPQLHEHIMSIKEQHE